MATSREADGPRDWQWDGCRLVTATAGADYLGPGDAIVTGIVASLCSYGGIVWKGKIGYDNRLDCMGIHGVGGILGTPAVWIFASKAVNPFESDGLFFRNSGQFGIQMVAVVATVIIATVGTYLILELVEGAMVFRDSPEEEVTGLNRSQHNERAYS